MNRTRRLKRGDKGTILLTSLICMMFIAVTGVAILTLTAHGLRSTTKLKRSTVAFNLSESGVDRTLRWLKDQPSPPTSLSSFDPFGGAQSLTGGSYTVVVTPDPGNSGAVLKKYTIRVVGKSEKETETVELVARQTSFGKYAYFTDRETSSVSGGRIWFFSGDRLRGPVHSNNEGNSDFQINWGGPGPIFEGQVTSAGDRIDYSPAPPTTEPQFCQIYLSGSRGYQLGVDRIPLPNSSDMQKSVAWNSMAAYPTTTGVYTNPDGGIYIHGDAQIAMLVDGSGNQQFRITQGLTVTTLTVDLQNNRLGKQVGSGATTWTAGSRNGVLYCQGNITSLSGTIANNVVNGGIPPYVDKRSAFTIATDVNGGKSITVSNSIKHKTAYDPTLGPTDPANLHAGTLGLIGRNVTVAAGAPTNLEIDAMILAGSEQTTDGSFSVADYSSKRPTGTLKVLGGIIQKARGPVGTLSGGLLSTGYAKDYWYDQRMADTPPPYFPTTGGYDRISWRRLVD